MVSRQPPITGIGKIKLAEMLIKNNFKDERTLVIK